MNLRLILFILLFTVAKSFSQSTTIDIYILDAYVTPENPKTLKLTFFTSEPTRTQLVLNEKYEFDVSQEYLEDHSFELKISDYKFDSTTVPYYVVAVNKNGEKSKTELYDFALPADYEIAQGEGPSLFTVCCFGGVIFGMPSPALAVFDDKSYFSLSKSIPIVSFYSGGYNYPVGVLSLEYSHIFDAPNKNFLRLGYNQLFQTKVIEYISPGVNGFTDFLGYNGISAELSVGWFKVYNVFTLYTKYRYNYGLNRTEQKFHEFSIGLYSSFFSINF